MLKILVVSHDAGGANILCSLIKKYHDNFEWITCTLGPARDIFSKKESNLQPQRVHLRNNDIDGVLKSVRPDYLLTGTSWASNFELNFIKHAKNQGIKTASFLDHWCNYRERFGYHGNWKKNLPDIVFVGDKWAYEIALKNGFSCGILRKVENPYFEEITKDANLLKKKNKKNEKNHRIKILYLSQPVSRHALKYFNVPDYWGYTEFEVLEDLLKVMNLQEKEFSLELKIRLHPAEKINKYSSLLNKKRYIGIRKLISVSNPMNNLLIKDCVWADVVVGSDSMALVVALIIGKYAISYVPDMKKTCYLPQKEIKNIHSINELLQEIKTFKKNGQTRNHKNRTAFDRAFLREIFN